MEKFPAYKLQDIRELPYPDFLLLKAMVDKEPSGSRADAYYFGQLMALTANVNRNSTDRPEPFLIEDFVPWSNQECPDEYLTEEELQAKQDTENEKAMEDLINALS
ncbi:hypothetical protein [Vibrio fortis]|uniref:phage tail assembly protein T n=1 Tax=Vibrio fortis TaxID=212667 RepID=UPI0038CD11E5